MTFTYTPGSGTDRDRVRARIGDTNPTKPLHERLEDEEIDDIIVTEGGWRSAAAKAADDLAGKFATSAISKRMGQASLEWQRFKQLTDLAKNLRSAVSLAAVPFAGGISVSVRDSLAQDTDRITPSFQKGMLDNPSSVSTTSTTTA